MGNQMFDMTHPPIGYIDSFLHIKSYLLITFSWSILPSQGNGILDAFKQHDPFTDGTSLELLSLSHLIFVRSSFLPFTKFEPLFFVNNE